jgi:hypothetical protein
LGRRGRQEAHQEIGIRWRDTGGEARQRRRGTGSGAADSGSGEHQGDGVVLKEMAPRPDGGWQMLAPTMDTTLQCEDTAGAAERDGSRGECESDQSERGIGFFFRSQPLGDKAV